MNEPRWLMSREQRAIARHAGKEDRNYWLLALSCMASLALIFSCVDFILFAHAFAAIKQLDQQVNAPLRCKLTPNGAFVLICHSQTVITEKEIP
jgi:hypothetical protein